jgi:hypothetical protein
VQRTVRVEKQNMLSRKRGQDFLAAYGLLREGFSLLLA